MRTINSLNELSKQVYQGNVEKGFWDKDRSFAETCMLIVSEISEAVEAHRKGHNCVYDISTNKVFEKFEPEGFKKFIKDTVEDEIADTFIRLLDLCGRMNIDIESHILLKLQYNKTRPRLHGKTY